MRTHVFSVLLLPTLAMAQGLASFTPYGDGCNGSPAANTLTQNATSPVLTVASLPNEYAYPVLNTSGVPLQVVGFEVFTVTNTLPTSTGNTGVLRDSTVAATVHTQPAFAPEAVGKITVTNVQGWYSTSVYPPVTIQPGEAFWISVDAFSLIAPPQAGGGTPGPAPCWWRRPNYLANAWVVSGSVFNGIFRVRCVPATPTVPALTATSLPRLGQNFVMQVSGGVPNLPAFVIWAFDNTQWISFPTPVDLALFGAPHCFNRTSSDIIALLLLDNAGQATTPPLTIPNVTSYNGLTWYNQAATLTPGINALGMLVTNAGTAVVGM